MSSTIEAPDRVVENINEIATHLDNIADGRLDDEPVVAALKLFTTAHVSQYDDEFDVTEDGYVTYIGDTTGKSGE